MFVKKLSRLAKILKQSFYIPYFGFISGHSHICDKELSSIKSLVGLKNPNIVAKFESGFAEIVGDGSCVSYASGRMGFFDLMRLLNIGFGDEVILPGATCAVMANAVLRTGATPIYSDIDKETFGSSAEKIHSCITDATVMIVAQHSFGIPCDIDNIKLLAESKEIFLLEDCALSLGSSVNGVIVGNFGDAALFSTDHSKPINTLTGGMIYTKDKNLHDMLVNSRNLCGELPIKKQNALWVRFLIERRFCNSRHYGKMGLVDFAYVVANKLFGTTDPFLTNDFKSDITTSEYSYPAKLPTFLAQLGVYEVKRWNKSASERIEIFKLLIDIIGKSDIKKYIPEVYTDPTLDIIPLRFVWSEPYGRVRRYNFSKFIHVDWTWFMSPIIATSEQLEKFGYCYGSCPISEKIGPRMVNIPCNIHKEERVLLLNKIKLVLG